MSTTSPAGGAQNRIQLFIDSADRAAAEPWLATGLFSGVTTNPQLLHEAGLRVSDIPGIYGWAKGHGVGEVCFQTWGSTPDELYGNALRIRDAAPEATVKVPVTPAGAQAISRLRALDIPILMTAVYSAKQALIGSALGVKYIAPYFNRMFRAGRNATDEIAHMTRAIPQDGSGPLVMAASIKSAQHLVTLTDIGVRVFTISPDVIADLFSDDLTAKAVADFEGFMAGLE